MQHKNGSFSNSFGFILACVGSAVGLGNIWMFPYRLGTIRRAVPFLFLIFCSWYLFGITGLSAEFANQNAQKQVLSVLMSFAGRQE